MNLGYGGCSSFQSNRKSYVVTWKSMEQTFWETSPFTAIGKPGIQLKLIDSATGPGVKLRNALWHFDSVPGEVVETLRVYLLKVFSVSVDQGSVVRPKQFGLEVQNSLQVAAHPPPRYWPHPNAPLRRRCVGGRLEKYL